ncbi:MAG TPA: hypothetical protein VIM33_08595 [Gaiellaceae bacterium]|jgi:hypothetical protein
MSAAGTLPTTNETLRVGTAVRDAAHGVDKLLLRLSGWPAPPSLELIGALYTLTFDLELFAGQMVKDAKRIEDRVTDAVCAQQEPDRASA